MSKAEPAPSTPADLRDRVQASLEDATPSAGRLAAYFLANLTSLPFETAASVAQKGLCCTNRLRGFILKIQRDSWAA